MQLGELDHELLAEYRRTWQIAVERAGDHLACRPGCTECCFGPFPITLLDAWRLRRGLGQLRDVDPVRAAAVQARAAQFWRYAAHGFPGKTAPGLFNLDEPAQEAFFSEFGDAPCPALDLAAGTCDLYDHRPLSCRSYGPPVRFGAERLPPCRLCFVGAGCEEVERCRVEPDVEDLEGRLLELLGTPDVETTVAAALILSVPVAPGLETKSG